MATITQKPNPPNTVGRRSTTSPQRAASPTSRAPTPSTTARPNGIGRTPSLKGNSVNRPPRAAVRRPGVGASNLSNTSVLGVSDDGTDEDVRAENAAILDELKTSLRNAETASEEYQRQLSMLQKRLDDSMRMHEKLENRLHQNHERIDELEAFQRDATRQKREMETTFESERTVMMRDRDEHVSREEELESAVRRLKESLTQRESRTGRDGERRVSRSPNSSNRALINENGDFPSSSSLQRSDSKNNSRLVMQKDRVIESLRLELAEAQIKLVEMENMGGGRLHDLEKSLLETRMTNARLMEDNESFQLLLSEKTLNGDFTKAEFMHGPPVGNASYGLGSLAEELESAEGESDNYRRLEAETRSLRDQNKALTLYVEKIISRVLQHENFETILDKTPDLFSSAPRPPRANFQKELPPPPPPKDQDTPPSILERAKSVVAGPGRRPRPVSQMISSSSSIQAIVSDDPPGVGRRPRPMSQIIASAPVPTSTSLSQVSTNEDPSTAPSIPLNRPQTTRGGVHRRTFSDAADAAAAVTQMTRGLSAGSGGRVPSGISPGGTSSRPSYFASSSVDGSGDIGNSTTSGTTRAASGSRAPSDRVASSSNSTFSERSGEAPSPPRNSAVGTNYTGAVMTQSRLRPLRLVQENSEMESGDQGRRMQSVDLDEAARKKSNRGSWMGWFNRGKDDDVSRSASNERNGF